MSKKTDRGTKRLCGECEAKFYDLNRDPIACPMCGTVFEPVVVATRGAPKPVPKAKVEEPVVEEKTEVAKDSDTVSLDEVAASEEADDTALEDEEALADIDDADDDKAETSENDDSFMVVEDEGATDVSGIVGGASKDEET